MVSDSKMRNNTNISKLQIPKLSTNQILKLTCKLQANSINTLSPNIKEHDFYKVNKIQKDGNARLVLSVNYK